MSITSITINHTQLVASNYHPYTETVSIEYRLASNLNWSSRRVSNLQIKKSHVFIIMLDN